MDKVKYWFTYNEPRGYPKGQQISIDVYEIARVEAYWEKNSNLDYDLFVVPVTTARENLNLKNENAFKLLEFLGLPIPENTEKINALD